jgi:hypothetical protein
VRAELTSRRAAGPRGWPHIDPKDPEAGE